MNGQCFCGAVKYRLTDRPMFVQCCHCLDCQAQTGSAFAINAFIERDRVELRPGSSEPVVVTMPTSSGRPHDVYRCGACQTALWSDYGRRRVMVFVRVATLDARSELVPDAHVFTRSKVSWVHLPPEARAYDYYYETNEEVWSPEALARRRAVLAPIGQS